MKMNSMESIWHTNTEKRLQEINELFQLITENTSDVISYSTGDGLCKYVSSSVQSLLGYETAELIGKRTFDFIHADDINALHSLGVNKAGGVASFRFRHKFGHYLWFESAFKSIKNEDGTLKYNISIARDITKRKQAEENLRQSEERFQSAFGHAPIGMALVDLNGQYFKVNQTLCSIIGYSEQELLQIGYMDITHPEDLNKHMQLLDMLMNRAASHFFLEKRYIHKHGSIIWALLGVSLVHDDEGNPLYFIAQIEDIMDRKKLELLRDEQEELMRRTDKLSTIGQLAASIAHEIRNPLTTIRGFIQLLSEMNTTNPQAYYPIILDELDRANDIISDFLALSKNRVIEKKMRSLNDIIHTLYPIISAEANLQGHTMVLDLDETISDLLLDDKEIKQLLLNLIRNGMEAMDECGTLTVVTRQNQEKVELQISDTGCGIPKAKMAQLFEPFYTTKEKGTGLGLMVCLNIVEKHGGTLTIQSEENKGTLIIITL
ncbi:two-component system, sporulation sensor kinase A [Paenibacillus sp. 1_12]|uniref:PAS domain-containing sensor histidine kinase n=1 Tax=Paenibacillus sp. 1_12 TaxID=1566278 RepID=UPI0008EB19C9|nr:PAS domain-containing sensor histidine kinase [Paenibacillus sp. 1_12]SFL94548.1 two-component system, sporulation sensor kinase A [Paenibacillus sp. 1_12]